MMPISQRSLLVLLLPLLLGGPRPASAEIGHPAVHRARRALARYDLQGDGSTEVIRSLGKVAKRLERASDRREARFLRAMAAADLWILSHRLERPGLQRRVIRALGVSEDELDSELIRELRDLSVGVYREAAADAIDALRVLQGREVDWSELSGPRSDVLFTGRVREILSDDADPVPRLAEMGAAPCSAGEAQEKEGCSDELERFGVQGRRAVGAVVAAQRALARIREAAASGDPFSKALRGALEQEREALGSAVLAPPLKLPEGVRTVDAPEDAAPLTAGLLLVVEPGQVRYGWVPRVRVAAGGKLELLTVGGGTPMLPEMRSVAIPRDFRPAVQDIDDLTAHLGELVRGEPPRVALASDPEIHAHVPSRVIRSALEAGMKPVMLVGRGPDGVARGVPIRVRDARKGPKGSPAARVRVRMGGYTVRTARGSTDVSRIREGGELRFDVKGLRRAAGETPPPSASVDYMTVAKMGPVVMAAFALAPERGAVQLLVP